MAAQQFLSYITVTGDRWDSLAWKFYGDATMYATLIEANPSVAIAPVLADGQRLVIPIIEPPTTPTTTLPPWGTL